MALRPQALKYVLAGFFAILSTNAFALSKDLKHRIDLDVEQLKSELSAEPKHRQGQVERYAYELLRNLPWEGDTSSFFSTHEEIVHYLESILPKETPGPGISSERDWSSLVKAGVKTTFCVVGLACLDQLQGRKDFSLVRALAIFFNEPLKDFSRLTWSSISPRSLISPGDAFPLVQNKLFRMKALYQEKKDQLSLEVQKKIQDGFAHFEQSLNQPKNKEYELLNSLDAFEKILNFPTQVRTISLRDVEEKVKELLITFDGDVVRQINELVEDIVISSQSEDHPKYSQRIAVSFVGKSGTGKTYMAEELAERLKMHLCKVSSRGEDLKYLLGEPAQILGTPLSSKVLIGRITECFLEQIENGKKDLNIILFFDRIDQGLSDAFETVLVKVLDRTQKYLQAANRGLGINVNTSRIVLLLAHRDPLKNKEILNQIDHTVVFKKVPHEVRRQLAYEFFKLYSRIHHLKMTDPADSKYQPMFEKILSQDAFLDSDGIIPLRNAIEAWVKNQKLKEIEDHVRDFDPSYFYSKFEKNSVDFR